MPGLPERVICRVCQSVPSAGHAELFHLIDIQVQKNRQTDPFQIYIPKQSVFAGSGRPFHLPGFLTASFAGSIWQCNYDYMNALK